MFNGHFLSKFYKLYFEMLQVTIVHVHPILGAVYQASKGGVPKTLITID